MDPQHRLLLEVVWEAIEDAGLPIERVRQLKTGVFVGMSTDDYYQLTVDDRRLELLTAYTSLGTSRSVGTGRISYLLGFNGPALQVDTSCSSSLVALHLAAQSLTTGESDVAIVAGINLILSPLNPILRSRISALSPTGACRAFDDAADGFVQGEGAVAVVLRRLSDATGDRGRIRAVLRTSAINHNGGGNGLTAPNGKSQHQLLTSTLKAAQLGPDDIDYLEAHGTGTRLGDPIEVEAIAAAYAGRPLPLFIGSVKTNFGHLEAAAGILAFIKTVLAVEHGEIVPQLNFARPNQEIDWDNIPVRVAARLAPWPSTGRPRRGAVSSFGINGSNAHCIIEEAPALPGSNETGTTAEDEMPAVCIPLSAKDETALVEMAQRYAAALATSEHRPRDWAFSAATGRSAFRERGAVVGRSNQELARGMEALAAGRVSATVVRGTAPRGARVRLGFAFSGQGAQYAGMGAALYRRFAAFRAAFDQVAALHRDATGGQSLAAQIFDDSDEALTDTGRAQPALFAIEHALAALWRSLGVSPAAVIGHSIGEYVAAELAGVLTLEEAYLLVLARARAMAALPPGGAMLSVLASAADLAAYLAAAPSIELAADNAAQACVLAGPAADLDRLAQRLEAAGLTTRRLHVSHAFHSAAMEPAMASVAAAAASVVHRAPRLPLAANLTSELATDGLLGPHYWARHMRETVRFREGVDALVAKKITHFLEIGPRPVLAGLLRSQRPGVTAIASLDAADPERAFAAAAAGLHAIGVDLDWKGLFVSPAPRRISIPTYPFQRQSYWLSARHRQTEADSVAPASPAAAKHIALEGLSYAPIWVRVDGNASVTPPLRWALAALGSAGPRLADIRAALSQPGAARPEIMASPAGASQLGADDAGIILVQEEMPVISALTELRRWLLALDSVLSAGRPVVLVTRGAYGVSAGVPPTSALAARALWGAVRAARIESGQNVKLGLLDIGTDAYQRGLSAALAAAAAGDELRLGPGGLARQRLAPLPLAPVRAVAPEDELGHAAVVTGGFGGLGWQLANHLVLRGVRELVLVGRSGPGAAVEAMLAAWRRAGVAVTVIAGDVAEPATWEAINREVVAQGHRIGAIYHLAGVLKDATIANVTEDDLLRVLRPKIDAASALLAEAAALAPQRIVFFGSLAGLLGAPGQFAYAAANAALEAASDHLVAAGIPTLTIAWAPLDAGMAALSRRGSNVERMPMMALATAWELMARATAAGLTELAAGALDQAGITAHDLASMPPGDIGRQVFLRAPARSAAPVAAHATAAVSPAQGEHTAAEKDGSDAGPLVQVQLAVAELMGERTADAVDPTTTFEDLGVDSLMLIRLREQLNTRLGLNLTTATLYSYPTARMLADHLTEQRGAKPAPVASVAGDGSGPARTPPSADAVAMTPAALAGAAALDELTQAEQLADELLRELGIS